MIFKNRMEACCYYLMNLTIKQNRGRCCTSLFRHAVAVVYLYDETDAKSFEDMNFWIEVTKRYGGDHLIFFLVGNKKDLISSETPRVVSDEQLQQWIRDHHTTPLSISALTGDGCEDAFRDISQCVILKFVFYFSHIHVFVF